MPNQHREPFARKLCSLYDHFYDDDFNEHQFSEEIMQSFLEFAGEYPENRKCLEIIEFGSDKANWDADSKQYGFKLKNQPYTGLSGILNTLERVPVPEAIEFRDIYPDMTQGEWQAAMRICSRILAAFSPHKHA